MTGELTPIEGRRELETFFLEVPPIDILRAIDGWKWLSLTGLTVIAVSAFGELFLLPHILRLEPDERPISTHTA